MAFLGQFGHHTFALKGPAPVDSPRERGQIDGLPAVSALSAARGTLRNARMNDVAVVCPGYRAVG